MPKLVTCETAIVANISKTSDCCHFLAMLWFLCMCLEHWSDSGNFFAEIATHYGSIPPLINDHLDELLTKKVVTSDDMRKFCALEDVDSEISLLSLIRKGVLKCEVLPYFSIIHCQVHNDENNGSVDISDAYSKVSEGDCCIEVSCIHKMLL